MFSSEAWLANPSSGFYNGVATQSLRFDGAGSSRIARTPSSASNQRTFTLSMWIKRSNTADQNGFFDVNASGVTKTSLNFHSDDALRLWVQAGNGAMYTSQLFRDLSGWFNLVWQANTTSPYVKFFINGTEVTAFSYDNRTTYPSTNNMEVNSQIEHLFGGWYGNGSYTEFSGYLAEINFVDGASLAPTSFGESKNGVWIAKDTSVLTFGTNGYRLSFASTDLNISGSAVDDPRGSSTQVPNNGMADASGGGNHFTCTNITAHNIVPDSPENNFSTINPLIKSGNTFSEGNLKVTTTTTAPAKFVSTLGVISGKWFMEFRHSGDGNYPFGITSDTQQRDYLGMSDGSTSVSIWGTSSNSNAFVNGSQVSWGGSGTTWSAGDIIGLALNADDSILEVYKNGSSIGSYDYSGLNWSEHFFAGGNYVAGTYSPNFGQDSTFQGAISAGGNADANGIGDFKYAVPSSYLAICTSNLPELTIGPNSATQADDYFNTVLYTGSGSTQTINTGFSTDFTWIKNRGTTNSHLLADSSRGSTKVLLSNGTNAEITDSNYTTFVSNGFSVSGSGNEINTSSGTYVSWNWKANGGTTTTNDASATSIGDTDSVIQANTDAGFSIVTYTGFSGSSGTATVAHGLSQAPEIIIHKSRTRTSAWWTQAPNVLSTASHFLALNESATPYELSSYGTMSAPTSSVFSINGVDGVGGESANYVAYCFHSVEGYSKIGGTYTGNGSTDGTFVYTGFAVKWLMIKRTDTAVEWTMFDSARSPFNVRDKYMYANTSMAEDTYSTVQVDFLSNGFKSRGTFTNVSGGTYIYMAFAEAPFKYANGG